MYQHDPHILRALVADRQHQVRADIERSRELRMARIRRRRHAKERRWP